MGTFPGYCQGQFWNASVSWNTDYPDLTPCLRETVLLWIPVALVWIMGPLEIWSRRHPRHPSSHFSALILSKHLLNLVLAILRLASLGVHTEHDLFPQVLETATVACTLILGACNTYMGIEASFSLPLSWSFFSLYYGAQLRSRILEGSSAYWEISALVLTILMLIFSSFSEKNVLSEGSCVVNQAPFYSYISYAWFTNIVYQGYFKRLSVEVFLPLCEDLRSSRLYQRFSSIYSISSRQEEVTEEGAGDGLSVKPAASHWSLLWALVSMVKKSLFLSIVLQVVSCLLSVSLAYVLHLILDYIQSSERGSWHGYFYASVFFVVTFITGITYTHAQYEAILMGVRIKSTLTSAIYKKVFSLSPNSRKAYTTGEIMNHMSVDTEELFNFVNYAPMLICLPVLAIALFIAIWQFLGPSCLFSIGIIACSSPLTYWAARKWDKLFAKQMEAKDKRLRIMSDILNGIKVLKLYAWEPPFMTQIDKVRKKELKCLRNTNYLSAIFLLIWRLVSQVITLGSFVIYILVNPNHQLTPSTIFVSFALFNMLRFPLAILPESLSHLIMARVSLRRIHKFLQSEDLDPNTISFQPESGQAITFRDVSMTWSRDDEPVLRDINLSVPQGSLVAVVGATGSGKSALLSAILGELYKVKGSINTMSPIAYVPQQAWIQNATLRNNILYTAEFNERFYQKVLKSCSLTSDLEILPGGDLAEIGEKGINLSGGQKQRVSLARAVYQDMELYLLDDPLSAVDAHVATHLFDHVIGPRGMLANKTRVLVTHALSHLPQTDWVVVLDKGRIVEQGTYQQLSSDISSRLTELIQTHLPSNTTEDRKELKRLESGEDATGQAEEGKLVEEEAIAEGQVPWKVYGSYFKEMGVLLTIGVVLGYGLKTVFEVGAGVWLAQWSSDQMQLQTYRVLVYLGLILVQGVFLLGGYFLLVSGALRTALSYHNKLVLTILRAPLSFFDVTPMGRIMNRCSKDIESIDNQILGTLEFWLNQLMTNIGVLITICFSSVYMLVVMLPICILYYIFLQVYIRTSRTLQRIESASRSPVYDNFSETISGTSCIRAFGTQPYFVDRSNRRVDANMNAYFHSSCSNRYLEFFLISTGGILVYAASIFAITNHTLSPGFVGLLLSYTMELTETLNWTVVLSTQLETQFVAVERLNEYCALKSEAQWDDKHNEPPPTWPDTGNISIDQLEVAYRPELPIVLSQLSLDIKPQEKVGIVGRTGAGKSSLVLALFRIIEARGGRITIDGVDISRLGLHTLRSRLTVIPQEPVIFAGSLRSNLDPWEKYTDAEIWAALEHAHLKEFISNLPEGLSHDLSEGGSNLSMGQRQLLCLARALLRKSRVLVLDEATASVDMDTDALVQETLRSSFSNCTTITIAHRLATIMDYDRVVVLSNGELQEMGSPSVLLADPLSTFHQMAHQAGLI